MAGWIANLLGRNRKQGKGRQEIRKQALDQLRSAQSTLITPERAELLEKAMEVRRAKQKILADLSDEHRKELAATAIRILLNDAPQKHPIKEDKTH